MANMENKKDMEDKKDMEVMEKRPFDVANTEQEQNLEFYILASLQYSAGRSKGPYTA